MSESPIEWTEHTFNPVTGCTRVSAGCDHCYASTLHNRRYKANSEAARKWVVGDPIEIRFTAKTDLPRTRRDGPPRYLPFPDTYDTPFAVVRTHPERLEIPLRRKKPTLYFTCSMGDLFHEAVPDAFIAGVFETMRKADWHTFQVLTKRPERARDFVRKHYPEPLPNVWLGTSVEDQEAADRRYGPMRELAQMGWFTWVSHEPALGAIEWEGWEFIRWMVTGGESGKGARPFALQWGRDARDWCARHDIPWFMKQLGSRPIATEAEWEASPVADRDAEIPGGKPQDTEECSRFDHVVLPLRDRKGGRMEEWPADLRIREMPR